jgi:hypothetical protein
MKSKYAFLVLFLSLISCGKYTIVKNGKINQNMFLYYCNDSLNCYATLFGDFDLKKFQKPTLNKTDHSILKRSKIKPFDGKILFSSNTGLEPYYAVIGVVRNQIDINSYATIYQDSTVFKKDVFGKFNIHEITYKTNSSYFSLLFYEKNETKKKVILNILDYDAMEAYTIDAIKNKDCSKEDIIKLANEYFTNEPSGNYLTFHYLKTLENNYQDTSNGIFRQILATYLSFASENNLAKIQFNKNNSHKGNLKFEASETNLDELIQKIKDKQLVLFNEAHHDSRHRYLLGLFLNKLYQNGFRYIGLEAFDSKDTLNHYGFPTLDNGFYLREPTMGNLVREAKKIGFIVFGYDSESKNREVEQAKNIYTQTFEKDKEAKIVILAGYSHIDKGGDWMAEKLKKISGIEPFTINQTKYSDFEDNKLLKGDIFVFEDPNKTNDLYLYNNFTINNNCFNDSLNLITSVKIPIKIYKSNIALIYFEEEYSKIKNPIPTFIKVLEKDQQEIELKLCPGIYRLVIKNFYNEIKHTETITIK